MPASAAACDCTAACVAVVNPTENSEVVVTTIAITAATAVRPRAAKSAVPCSFSAFLDILLINSMAHSPSLFAEYRSWSTSTHRAAPRQQH